MTEPLSSREVRENVRARLATAPSGVDQNGRNDADRQADADRAARFEAARLAQVSDLPTPAPEPAPVGMQRNPAQGGSAGGIVPAPAPTDPLAAIRAQASKLTEF